MASVGLNKLISKTQRRTLTAIISSIILVGGAFLLLIGGPSAKKKAVVAPNLTGVVDNTSFTEANTESALSAQQSELESLKSQMADLKAALEIGERMRAKDTSNLALLIKEAVKTKPIQLADNASQTTMTDATTPWQASASEAEKVFRRPHVQVVSFRYKGASKKHTHSAGQDYVPSGTFVRAVVLGGADADASVNGQSKNNGVMLFKLLQPGTLPNGKRSHLEGCFVTASSYGDISSERAYVILDKLSCAQSGRSVVDKAVTGWAFFGGKVGIKGKPLMRDNKIMQWAGISGALSGIASAAQYGQSVQSISPLGSATTVPTGNIAPYAAYGGASKAAEVLSNYYVKRAEQYHPVIQIGSGNLVTIVFKDGFYLESEEEGILRQQASKEAQSQPAFARTSTDENPDFAVPPEVLGRINPTYHQKAGDEL